MRIFIYYGKNTNALSLCIGTDSISLFGDKQSYVFFVRSLTATHFFIRREMIVKISNKNYFMGLIIGGGGAILAGHGIALLTEAVQQIITMITQQGYSAVDAILHIFGDSFGLILLNIGICVICEGVRKSRS